LDGTTYECGDAQDQIIFFYMISSIMCIEMWLSRSLMILLLICCSWHLMLSCTCGTRSLSRSMAAACL